MQRFEMTSNMERQWTAVRSAHIKNTINVIWTI